MRVGRRVGLESGMSLTDRVSFDSNLQTSLQYLDLHKELSFQVFRQADVLLRDIKPLT